MMRKALFGAAMAVTFLAGCGGGDEPFTPPPGNGGPPPPQLPSPASAPALKTMLAAKFGVVEFSGRRGHRARLHHQRHGLRAAAQALQQHHGRKRHEAGHALAQHPGHLAAGGLAQLRAGGHHRELRANQQHPAARPHAAVAPDRFRPGCSTATLRADPANYRTTFSSTCATTSSPWSSAFPRCTPGTWSTKWPATRRTPQIPIAPTASGGPPTASAGMNGSDYVRDAFTFANQARSVDRQDQREHEAHAERLQHRAARQTRQRHADRAGRW